MSGITAEEIKSSLEQNLHGKIEAVTVTAPRRIFLTVQPLDLPQVARFLHDKLGVTHISTITGRDTGTNVEALYHYSKDGNVVTVRVPTARDNGSIPSIISLFAGAALYEREVHDILGVHFDGNGDLRPLVLPDGWPAGVYPLRKDWTYNQEDGVLKK